MFKENFIRICAEKGVSPTSVCVSIGLSSSVFSQWTENTVPRKTTLIKLANALGVTVDYLLGNEPTSPASPAAPAENVVIYHRDGKTVTKKFSKDQMEMLAKMIDAIPEEEDG